jgi:antitoxin MazE
VSPAAFRSNYNVVMRASIIQIGNSRGLRIPRTILEQAGLRKDVEIEAHRSYIVVRAPKNPREGWEDAFRRMAQAADDVLLDADALAPTKFDETEWTW